MVSAGFLLRGIGMKVVEAERKLGSGHGEQKQEYAIDAILGMLSEEKVISLNPFPDINELIELIGNVIDAVVALLNFLGIFKHAKKESKEKKGE